eukprot:GFYU01001024.1.p1 GENE.GFYU01001024.1~~GFYU01001024.1.p1  ORF type:complete len:243 (-),score=70.99 GFYU01001024.1:280-1008(-)
MSFFDALFGKPKTLKEQVREYKRSIDRSVRELDRERTNLQRQEKKIMLEIKRSAKDGQMNAAKVMAKDLVRTRRYVDKFYKMRTQLQGIGLRLQTVSSTQTMQECMRGVTQVMMGMNKSVNLPAMQKIMMEFEKQSEQMDMREEMVGDAIDDAMEDEEDEEEEEQLINGILDEIGIERGNNLADAPTQPAAGQKVAAPRQPQAVAAAAGGPPAAPTTTTAPMDASDPGDDDLQKRLDDLRKQ